MDTVNTRCPAVYFPDPTVPFVIAPPVRCTKDAEHLHHPSLLGDVWHAASGQDLDGEVFGAAWRYMLALPR